MKMIKLMAMLLLMSMAQQSVARDGYHITLKMTDVKDTLAYLVHYYGKGRPTIFITDSVNLDKNGVAVFNSTDKDFVGGIYIILLGDKARTNFEFLLNKGDEFSITATKNKLPDGVKFKNSPENDRFEEYVDFLKGYSKDQEKFTEELKEAKTTADTDAIRKKAVASAKVLTNYRRDYEKGHPGSLLATIFNAMETRKYLKGHIFLQMG